MNTPSHHRVHHGADEKYIDKNHAGVFIIWDRMFGTFQEEEEGPTYGIVTPLQSWNPIWGHLHYWVRLFNLSRAAKSLKEKILVWFKSPPWLPEGMEGTPLEKTVRWHGYQKFDVPIGKGLTAYAFIQFLTMMGMVSFLMFSDESLEVGVKLPIGGMILWTLLCVGGLLEKKKWAFFGEALRLFGMFLFLGTGGMATQISPALVPVFEILYTVCFVWLLALRKDFADTARILV